MARRSPTGTVRRQPAPQQKPMPRKEEILLSRTTPGRVSASANPLTLTLSNYGIDIPKPKPEHRAAVAALIADLKKQGIMPIAILVHGYADDTGTDEHNIPLSWNRASAIKDLLQPLGAPVLPLGHGEFDPAGPNDTVERRNLNRRVLISFMIYKKSPPPPEPDDDKKPKPFNLCETLPWLCGEEKKKPEKTFCEKYPILCPDGPGIPLWPLLPLICVAQPELCLGLACLLDPWACLPCWPFCDEPDEPKKPKDKCNVDRLNRGLSICEQLDRLIDRLCGSKVQTASAGYGPANTMPMMFPTLSLAGGGGYAGLMQRDRARQQLQFARAAVVPARNPSADQTCSALRSGPSKCRDIVKKKSGCGEDRGPCNEPLPILWPRELPLPRTKRDLVRRGGDDSSGDDRNQTGLQRRLQERIRSNRDRNLPPPQACPGDDMFPNAPRDAHHVQPLFLDGKDDNPNLCALDAEKHQDGHPRLNNQTEMVATDPTWHQCGVTESRLNRHPANQHYEITGRK